jgi:hypothetical protein
MRGFSGDIRKESQAFSPKVELINSKRKSDFEKLDPDN